MGLRSRVVAWARKVSDGPHPVEVSPEKRLNLRRRLSSSDRLVTIHPDPHIEELHIKDYTVRVTPPRRSPVPSRVHTAPAVLQHPWNRTNSENKDGSGDQHFCGQKFKFGASTILTILVLAVGGVIWLMIFSPCASSFLALAGLLIFTSIVLGTGREADEPGKEILNKVENRDGNRNGQYSEVKALCIGCRSGAARCSLCRNG